MNKKTKLGVIALFSIIVGIFGIKYYIDHGGERNLSSEDAAFTVTSKSITDEFTNSMEASNKKYLEKAVAISGKITATSPTGVTIDKTIICNLTTPDTSLKNDQTVTVKGRIVGYDELMGELKLDQCSILKN